MGYFARRSLQAIITVWGVITVTFVLIRLMPGGPLDYVRAQLAQTNQDANPERLNALAEAYISVNPDKPIYLQYIDYISSVLVGDLGRSFHYREPVAAILQEALPWTIFIMSLSLLSSFFIAIVLGSLMGYYEGSKFDIGATFASIVFNSIPYYIMGLLLLLILSHNLELFPTGGTYSSREIDAGFNLIFFIDVLHHAVLPVVSFAITVFGMLALLMRGNCISILGQDYMRVAELRGLPERKIALGYLGRNAILPLYTEFMISIGFMFGGSIILEEIFRYPGVGFRMFQAISSRDHPLMMGAFLVITIAVVVGVYVADLTYGKLDPRVGLGDQQ